nr:hypothetical protein [Tanacetum cinerariifolium]
MVRTVEQPYKPTTIEEKLDRKNEMKARGTLLMALLNKDQLKFHSYQDVKLLMEAIEKRSKVECFNCHKNRHFIRECRALKNQENKDKEYGRKTIPVENLTENALIAQDGIGGYDWSYQAKEEHPTNFTLMVLTSSRSSSNSDSEENAMSRLDKGYHAVPPPYIGNYIPPKPDLMFTDEQVKSKLKTAGTPVNAVRPVNNADSKPIVNYSRPTSNAFKRGYSQAIRPFNNKDNIYSIDLKSVVPTEGLTCLFAMAITDESNLWHRRLGHINYKTMNKLNGKQHKASYKAKLVNSISKPLHMLHMDLFENQLDCKVKIIRCDNGTEFKNSVLNQFCDMKKIKREFSVARTPQQNGVAERKNRTLIEVVRTMIVEETLNIRFLENAPNVKGNGLEWLFDIDYLKISMNYVPVVTGFQTNGPKDSAVDAGKKATKVDESQVSDNGRQDDQVTRSEFKGLLQQESHTKHTNSTNSFNTISSPVNTAGPSFVNAASPSPINLAGTPASTNAFEKHPFERFSPFKNAFTLLHVPIVTPINDTRIFGNAYDDEAVEKEIDMNNVVSSYTIPDAPLTKFLKDQVIGSIETPVQTRQMTKMKEEHGLIFSVQKLRRTNHNNFQNCLFACYLSQMEPKKPVQALKDPSWVEAMQDELL